MNQEKCPLTLNHDIYDLSVCIIRHLSRNSVSPPSEGDFHFLENEAHQNTFSPVSLWVSESNRDYCMSACIPMLPGAPEVFSAGILVAVEQTIPNSAHSSNELHAKRSSVVNEERCALETTPVTMPLLGHNYYREAQNYRPWIQQMYMLPSSQTIRVLFQNYLLVPLFQNLGHCLLSRIWNQALCMNWTSLKS